MEVSDLFDADHCCESDFETDVLTVDFPETNPKSTPPSIATPISKAVFFVMEVLLVTEDVIVCLMPPFMLQKILFQEPSGVVHFVGIHFHL